MRGTRFSLWCCSAQRCETTGRRHGESRRVLLALVSYDGSTALLDVGIDSAGGRGVSIMHKRNDTNTMP